MLPCCAISMSSTASGAAGCPFLPIPNLSEQSHAFYQHSSSAAVYNVRTGLVLRDLSCRLQEFEPSREVGRTGVQKGSTGPPQSNDASAAGRNSVSARLQLHHMRWSDGLFRHCWNPWRGCGLGASGGPLSSKSPVDLAAIFAAAMHCKDVNNEAPCPNTKPALLIFAALSLRLHRLRSTGAEDVCSKATKLAFRA